MSKTLLRKELKNFDHAQLCELLLDVYSSSKEAQEYLEFFLAPDIDKLYEKYRLLLEKELSRGKYGRSTARISHVRRIIKKFDSFGAGPEYTLRLMAHAALKLVTLERHRNVGTPLVKGTATMLTDMLVMAERNLMLDKILPAVEGIIESEYTSRYFKKYLHAQVQEKLDTMGLNAKK